MWKGCDSFCLFHLQSHLPVPHSVLCGLAMSPTCLRDSHRLYPLNMLLPGVTMNNDIIKVGSAIHSVRTQHPEPGETLNSGRGPELEHQH
ncbi:unnamed protein product [Merluccius merluccius]